MTAARQTARQTAGTGARGRDRARVRPLRRRRHASTASPTTAAASGPPPEPSWSPSIPRAASSRARSTAPATPAPPSTARTSTRSPKRASTRSIPPPATSWRRSRRPATAATRASPGPRAACGWGSTAIARSTRSIPTTGAILRTIESNRFVTGVTWVDGELWHGTWEGDESEIRRIDPESGAVLERLEMPRGTGVSGLESDGADLFYCGGGRERKGPRRATSEGRSTRDRIDHRPQGAHHEHRHCRSEHP